MERRNRSLEALRRLYYIESLDDYSRAQALELWIKKYLKTTFENEFDLELADLQNLSELLYKNINFLKQHSNIIKKELEDHDNIKKFFN